MTPGNNDALCGGMGEATSPPADAVRRVEAAAERTKSDAAVIGALARQHDDLKHFGARQYIRDD